MLMFVIVFVFLCNLCWHLCCATECMFVCFVQCLCHCWYWCLCPIGVGISIGFSAGAYVEIDVPGLTFVIYPES